MHEHLANPHLLAVLQAMCKAKQLTTIPSLCGLRKFRVVQVVRNAERKDVLGTKATRRQAAAIVVIGEKRKTLKHRSASLTEHYKHIQWALHFKTICSASKKWS